MMRLIWTGAHTMAILSDVMIVNVFKVSFMVPVFFDHLVAKKAVESCTGKRNLVIALDIVR